VPLIVLHTEVPTELPQRKLQHFPQMHPPRPPVLHQKLEP
jgi:hypothetical protein